MITIQIAAVAGHDDGADIETPDTMLEVAVGRVEEMSTTPNRHSGCELLAHSEDSLQIILLSLFLYFVIAIHIICL